MSEAGPPLGPESPELATQRRLGVKILAVIALFAVLLIGFVVHEATATMPPIQPPPLPDDRHGERGCHVAGFPCWAAFLVWLLSPLLALPWLLRHRLRL